MARKARKATDYRTLKKALNSYHKFSFKTPRKGKDFTPAQKSAITQQFNKLKPYLNNDTVTWLDYPKGSKLPGVDGARTNKGMFFKYPGASVKYSKKDKKYHIIVAPKAKRGAQLVQKRRDVLYIFPPSVIGNPERIIDYVAALVEKYSPHDIRWSIAGKRESQRYDKKVFFFYFSVFNLADQNGNELDDDELTDDEVDELDATTKAMIYKKRKRLEKMGFADDRWQRRNLIEDQDANYYNGVYLVYYI